jgi:3-oxoacyl-[acyl-carrier-protein] synthase III
VKPSRTVGIRAVAAYVPEGRKDLAAELDRYGVSADFLRDKTGCLRLARKGAEQETSDLAVEALRALESMHPGVLQRARLLIAVTQNGDGAGLPHTSAVIHGKLGLGPEVAAFDLSLGCSGWVYGLSVAKAFMEANGIDDGLLVTADPYSKVVDPGDRDTALLFGDAATTTWLSAGEPVWHAGAFAFGTDGSRAADLQVGDDHLLHMNGRGVLNFSATRVPACIHKTLELNATTIAEVDRVVLHQGSRYICKLIGERIGAAEKTPFLAEEVGNTVSSSIPLILAQGGCDRDRLIVVAGFGVGLSWAATVLRKVRT